MIEEIEILLSKSISETKANPKPLMNFYKYFYNGYVCWTCPNAIEANYNRLKTLKDKPIMEESKNILRLKKGVVLDTYMATSGPIGHFTNANVTDEISIELIERGFSASFENPEDIEKAFDLVYADKPKQNLTNNVNDQEKRSNEEIVKKTKKVLTTKVK